MLTNDQTQQTNEESGQDTQSSETRLAREIDPQYLSRFGKWPAGYWFKEDQIDYSGSPDSSKAYFSARLFPAVDHPLVLDRGYEFRHAILKERFCNYAHFTAVLEREGVNPALSLIAGDKVGIETPHRMMRDAGKILNDESFHAVESDRILDAVCGEPGIRRHTVEPAFLSNLEQLMAPRGADERKVLVAGFASVSETLISGLLSDIPHDATVRPEIRSYVRMHAIDEGRHHAYFQSFLALYWERLSDRNKELLGRNAPSFIRWFLEPDFRPFRSLLAERKFTPTQVDRIVAESFPEPSVRQSIRVSAAKTIGYFREAGALALPAAEDAFAAAGMLDEVQVTK